MHTRTESSFLAAVRKFFLAEEIPFGMALIRILLPLILLTNVIPRWQYARELYSSDGAPAPMGDNFHHPDMLMEFPGAVVVGVYTVLVLLLITSSIGWYTRLSLIGSVVLYAYFGLMDSMSTITKYTVIASHLLLLLSVSPCGAVWSVDAWLKNPRRHNPLACGDSVQLPRFPIWPQRLAQLLLALIYFGAAVTKMHTPSYFSGDQLMYWMMTYFNSGHPLGDYLSQYPVWIVVCSYIALVWEITFIALVWQKRMRLPMLFVGVMFHAMTTVTLGLIVFPLVMFAGYFAFLTEADVSRISAWYRRWQRKDGWLAKWCKAAAGIRPQPASVDTPRLAWPRYAMPVAFGLLVALVALGGVEAEYRLDPYHLRGPEGPLALKPVSDEEAERLLTNGLPLRESDKFFAFDLGTVMVGEHLVNRRKEFRVGERLLAQVTLNPPHDDLWLECILFDAAMKKVQHADGPSTEELAPSRLINRAGHIVPRELMRSNFVYHLDESMDPGDYFFVFRSKGQEVNRKKFTLLPRLKGVAAN